MIKKSYIFGLLKNRGYNIFEEILQKAAMIKKFLYIIFFIFIFVQSSFAGEVFKITSVSFDTSNSLIFLTSPDNTTEEIMKHVKLIKLANPKRVYFDINSTVLSTGAQNWYLNSGGVKQVKISQFSSNPSSVRVVLYLDESFDQSKINYLKVNNNIVLEFKDGLPAQSYFQNIYRDEKSSSGDFYEKLSISNEEIEAVKTVQNLSSNDAVFNQVQQSFNSNNSTSSGVIPVSTDIVKKELRLKSKYYLNSIAAKDGGFWVSGFGTVCVEKPIYFNNPARVAFDISNVLVNSDVKNRDFKIGNDILRINQIEQNKARVLITSLDLDKYFPIYSSDSQSVLFVKSDAFDGNDLFTKINDALSYDVTRKSAGVDDFVIRFNAPVVYGVKREPTKLIINFYNTLRFNEQSFKSAVTGTDFDGMTMELLPKVGLKLVLPLEKVTTVSCFTGADGKSVKIFAKGLPNKFNAKAQSKQQSALCYENAILPKCKGKKSIVLDAGHGGTDYGAIRCGVNEKDINLDIVKRVQAILASKNVSVALTRDSDVFIPLSGRTDFCAKSSPDIFVSVHVNSSSKPEINGIETHYYHPNSVELANVVHSCLISNLKRKDRGIFKSKFYVINHTDVPAILVEIGFISNAHERAELVSEGQKQQAAKAIAEGVLKYLNLK